MGHKATATARFGSSRRESHDASAFYDRFVPPQISGDATVNRLRHLDVVHHGDARDMAMLEPGSVALVVTSPPYFAGKEYETALGQDGVPASYFEYLALLRDVFAQCREVLEPGGRIAVNVANLGRRPYRSLAGDVTQILQDLGLLLRGEVVWWKGRAAGGSCAWGTFQRPGNPVLRDVTERIVIASKGRFDRALTPAHRQAAGLPSAATISRDEFLEATTDLWEIPPESATRVGHPAPFPVELPRRLIELYTYEDDVVLDPFMGSGTTAVAAVRTGRHFVGFETDAAYLARARLRIAEEQRQEREGLSVGPVPRRSAARTAAAAVPGPHHERPSGDNGTNGTNGEGDPVALAVREGRQAREIAGLLLSDCGFADVRADVRLAGLGVVVSFAAADREGGEWLFEVCGAFATGQAGLKRVDALWRAIGKAAVVHQAGAGAGGGPPLVLLTTDLPAPGSAGAAALAAVTGPGHPVSDVVELLGEADRARLRSYAAGGPIGRALVQPPVRRSRTRVGG